MISNEPVSKKSEIERERERVVPLSTTEISEKTQIKSDLQGRDTFKL